MSIIERVFYIYINICIEFLASYFRDPSRCLLEFTGWAIIEELSIRQRVRTFLISWGRKRARNSYVDLL